MVPVLESLGLFFVELLLVLRNPQLSLSFRSFGVDALASPVL